MERSQTMKRKTLLILFISTTLLTGCASTEITQTKTDTTVELGSACNLNITDFFELGSKVNTSDILIDTSSVDANTIGDYEATVTYKKNTYKINVSVTDTTAPIVTAKTDIEPVLVGTSIKASDFVEVNDASDYTVYFVTDDDETETINIPSDYTQDEMETTIIAVDTQDNRSEATKLYIKAVLAYNSYYGWTDVAISDSFNLNEGQEVEIEGYDNTGTNTEAEEPATEEDAFDQESKEIADAIDKALEEILNDPSLQNPPSSSSGDGALSDEEYYKKLEEYGGTKLTQEDIDNIPDHEYKEGGDGWLSY